MDLSWLVDAPELPEMSQVEQRTSVKEFTTFMEAFMTDNEGYLEVRPAGSEYPLVTLGFRHGLAVVHRFTDEQSVGLLRHEHATRGADLFAIPVHHLDSEFTADFVLPLREAWAVVKAYAETGALPGSGSWTQL
jgi:hypothetical protein